VGDDVVGQKGSERQVRGDKDEPPKTAEFAGVTDEFHGRK
jgi:hypothetical protein